MIRLFLLFKIAPLNRKGDFVTKKEVLDLGFLDTKAACNQAVEIELVHPVSKESLGIFISILGKESDVFQETINARINAQLRKNAVSRGKPTIVTVEGNQREAIDLLADCTTGWRSGEEKHIRLKGEDLVFNRSNAIKLYSEMSWIKDQVDEAIGDLSLFFRN